ncbi:hypothetical protein DVH24_034918 [Malus domestica]|uniref:At1g61320/AtMIF1 LRR domain-containing protein n=1 Tax=Malus domestica TaxID=3750 RepID=A0A498IHK4_MALDO|nr:hypothetical protein DVH24_034918 [Malus domestica]
MIEGLRLRKLGVQLNNTLATASRSESMTMVDRFSDLPIGVTHHILSFLNIRDLTCFSIASKRCIELYLSTPSLDFGDLLPKRTPKGSSHFTCEFRLKLLSSLDRFLLKRGDNKIKYFRLFWTGHLIKNRDRTPCFCVNENFRIVNLIHNAVRCNVEVLDIFLDEKLAFPFSIFLCETLKSLVINMPSVVKTPSVAFSSNLEYLELMNVEIKDEGFFKWISCSCKSIKELILCGLGRIKNITIESSSLEKFELYDGFCTPIHLNISGEKLETIRVSWRFRSSKGKSLNIFAPKLKYLFWRGNVMKKANLGKLECVEEASMFLEPKADDFDNLLKVFCSMHRVEYLVINEATIKALFSEGGSTQARFNNLSYLEMDIRSFSDELVPALVSLLRGMPNLCTLYVGYHSSRDTKSDVGASRFDVEHWKLQHLEFIHQTEEVTIALSSGSNGIEFARYILENAEKLEQMTIIHLPEQSDAVQKLNESKMMSKATVIFKEDS